MTEKKEDNGFDIPVNYKPLTSLHQGEYLILKTDHEKIKSIAKNSRLDCVGGDGFKITLSD